MEWLVIFSNGEKRTYVNMSLYEVGQSVVDEGRESEVVAVINNGICG